MIVLFFLSSILFFPILLLLKRRFFGSVTNINFFNASFLLYFVFCYLGAALSLLGFAEHSYFISPILTKNDIVNIGSISILWGGLAMFYTFIILLHLLSVKFNNIKWDEVINNKIVDSKKEIVTISFFCLLGFLCFFYYQIVIYPSPLILSLEGNHLEVALKRIQITRYLSEYANTYLVSFGMIICQLFSIQLVIRNNPSIYERILKFFMFLITVLFLFSNSEKAPVLFYIFTVLLAHKSSKGNGLNINLYSVIFMLLLLLIIYYIFVSNDINEILSLILERVVFAQMAVVYYVFDFYNETNFIGFNSLGGIFKKILGLSTAEPYSVEMMSVYFHEMIANGGWNINGFYISEAWANFGIVGVILSPIYIGFMFSVLYFLLTRTKGSFYRAILFYYTTSSFSFLTSLNIYIYNSIFMVIFTLIIIRLFFSKALGVFKKQ